MDPTFLQTRYKWFDWAGVPVFVGITQFFVLLYFLVTGLAWGSAFYALVRCGMYMGITLLHEAGHAVAARRRGLKPTEIELHALHGLCRYQGMRITREDQAVVSWAGVLPQIALGLLAWLFFATDGTTGNVLMDDAMRFLATENMLLVGINLLPIRGLDGYTAWSLLKIWRGELDGRADADGTRPV